MAENNSTNLMAISFLQINIMELLTIIIQQMQFSSGRKLSAFNATAVMVCQEIIKNVSLALQDVFFVNTRMMVAV
jgi:hypothetical protein